MKFKSKQEWDNWLLSEKLKITHVDQIDIWFLENQKAIMDGCNLKIRQWPSDKFCKSDEYTKLDFDIKWKSICSNTHAAPSGKPENFRRKDDLPLGYPGWHGTLEGSLKRAPKNNGSYPYTLAYNLVGIRTHSGGGGNGIHSYTITIFLDDWPGLGTLDEIESDNNRKITKLEVERAYNLEQEKIIRRLKGYYW